MIFEIKSRYDLSVLFSLETESLKLCIEAAVGRYADLRSADLSSADLSSANLRSATIRDDIKVSKAPLQILGLAYPIIIWDSHMQIGCEFHSLSEWAAFDDARIVKMEGRTALTFWRTHKDALLAIAKSDGRE